MMDDLISRQAVLDAFNTNLNELVVGGEENAKTVENYLNRVLDKIKCLPSVQPETYWKEQCQSYEQTINKLRESLSAQPEIIRGKDCRYYNSEEKECLDLLGHGRRWEEDDFCSYAERGEVTE